MTMKTFMLKLSIPLCLALLGGGSAYAADRYWAPSGCDPSLGGAATWDSGTTANWSPNETGGGCVTWNNAASDSAFFIGTAAHAVTVNGNKTVNKIYRVAGGANANVSSSVTIAFAGDDSGVHSDAGGYLTLGCNFSGTLTKTGAGRLEANNSNNTVKWILKEGMVTFAAANRFNLGASGYKGSDFITFDGGGLGIGWSSTLTSKTLASNKGITIKEGGAFFGASNGGNDMWIQSPIIDGTGGTGNGGLSVTAGSPLYSPYASGGIFILTNLTATPNSYRGPTRVYAGTLRLGSTNQIPDGSNLEVRGGTFNTGGFSETVASVLMTGGTITGGGTLTGTNGYDLRAGSCATVLGGAGIVATKSTDGVLNLTAANTFTGGFNHDEGTVRVNSASALGPANSTVNLANGVTLSTSSTTARTLTYLYNVNGDITLGQATGGTAPLTLAGWVNLGGATRTIQVDNATNIISAVITNGGLTKTGAGTLRLTGANTYTGPTTVNSGILVATAASAGGGSYAADDGATLGVQAILPGGPLAMSGLTLGNFSSATTEFDFAHLGIPSTSLISVAGDVTLNGTVYVNAKGFDTVGGPVTLLEYAGNRPGGGSFTEGVFPPRVTATITDDTVNKKVILNATAADSLVWVSDFGGWWTVNDGWNFVWKLASNGTPTDYQENAAQGDTVRFDDTATGSTTVDIWAPVSPYSVTVDNTTQDYSFVSIMYPGAGKISGSGTLTKSGTGQLTITNANDFAGGTTLNAGTINIGNNAALGTGRLTVNGGKLGPDSATARTLSVPGTLMGTITLGDAVNTGVLTLSGAWTIGSDSAQVAVDADVSATISGAIGQDVDGRGLTKTGNGTLNLTGASTFSGGFNHNAGTVRVNNNAALGAANSIVNLADGVTLSTSTTSSRTLTYAFNVNGDVTLGQETGGTAVVTLAGSMNLGGVNRTFTLVTNATISAVVSDGGLTKTGSATLTLSGNNLYTGDTTNRQGAINPGTTAVTPFGDGGTLRLEGGHIITSGGRAALPILNPIVMSTDTTFQGSTTGAGYRDFPISGSITTVDGTLTLKNAGTTTGIWNTRLHADTLNFTRPIIVGVDGDPGQVHLSSMNTNAVGEQTFSGVISGYGVFNRAASVAGTGGKTLLAAPNTYSGGTTVSDGTLLVNNTTGSGTGTGAVAVYANGVLGGTGTIAGAVVVTNGGSLNAGESAGTLTLENGLDLGQGGTNVWELAANTTSGDGINFDQIALTGGNLVLGGSSRLLIKFVGTATFPASDDPFWQSARSWKVISLAGGANPDDTVFAGVDGVEGNTAGTFSTTADAAGIYLNFNPGVTPPEPYIDPNVVGAGTASAQLSWSSVAGAGYTVQYKTNLNQTGWLTLTNLTAEGTTTTIVDNTSPVPNQRYYRVVSP